MNKTKIQKDLEINFWRQHIMEGLLKALRMPDKIKEGFKQVNAKFVLTEQLQFSNQQAQSLLNLKDRLMKLKKIQF